MEYYHLLKLYHLFATNQCIIYDSDKPDARLIGIEYIVDEAVSPFTRFLSIESFI